MTDTHSAGQTIVGVPFESPHNLTSLLSNPEHADDPELAGERKLFKIRLASNQGRRTSASMLIKKMYSWRGYETSATFAGDSPNRITLVASADAVTLGTITVGLDSPSGLLVDALYKQEIDPLRESGHRVCEFIKLAIDHGIRSKRVLGAIFHIAVIYARGIHRYTDLLIEVNPRHVFFYEKMLGFKRFGPERTNPRVNAPAVLLHLEFSYLEEQVERFGGQAALGTGERSLYPYFFSPSEARGITSRLLAQ